jgi:hypothetical protein
MLSLFLQSHRIINIENFLFPDTKIPFGDCRAAVGKQFHQENNRLIAIVVQSQYTITQGFPEQVGRCVAFQYNIVLFKYLFQLYIYIRLVNGFSPVPINKNELI